MEQQSAEQKTEALTRRVAAHEKELALLKASLEKNGVLKSCLETAALQHRANRTKG